MLIALLGILTFIIIRPIILSIFGGLILAYIFSPLHRKIVYVVKNKTISAALVSIIVLIIIILPIWLLAPLMIDQAFEFFKFSQNSKIAEALITLFQNSSPQFQSQITAAINVAFSKISSFIIESLVGVLANFAVVALHLFLVAFVFFFTLRDSDKLKEFASGLSPLNKAKERIIVKQFNDMTQSIVYGQIITGLIQGIFVGIGLLLFRVPNSLLLTILATVLSIIPMIGPAFVYIPTAIYLMAAGNPVVGVGYLIYNLIFASTLDNFIRAHLVARKTAISPVLALIGMIGGLFIFGFLGLIIGPLIIGYFITFLKAYKEKNLSSFFEESD
mgnify:CR=1 FL=1